MVDTQSLLLPGVVAVVVGLSVIYLIYRLFVSSSSAPQKNKGSKKPKKKPTAKKANANQSSGAQKAEKKKEQPKPVVATSEAAVVPKADTKDEPVAEQPKGKKASAKKRRSKEVLSEEENISDFLPILAAKDKANKAGVADNQEKGQPKVSGKNKIAAAKEEPLAEGWEIVGLRKKEWKDVKKKERDEELEKLRKEEEEKKALEEKKKEGKRPGNGKKGDRPERREGREGREGRDRGQKGNRPFKNRKNQEQEKEEKVTTSPQVSEKTKRREEIKINGILFSKFKDDDEDEDEDFDLLSEIIENGSSDSDDITPLRTAHLELRYYTLSKDTPSPSLKKKRENASVENQTWAPTAGELAKYNYTQGKSEVDKEKEEGAEVPSSRVWDLEESGNLPDENTSELIEAYIKALGHPFTSNLAPARLSGKGKPQRFLVKTDADSLRARLLKLLSSGVSLEPPVCRSQSEAAEFVEKLLGYLDAPFVCYTNQTQSGGSKFWRKGFGDAGFFIISATKIVMIWFIGYD